MKWRSSEHLRVSSVFQHPNGRKNLQKGQRPSWQTMANHGNLTMEESDAMFFWGSWGNFLGHANQQAARAVEVVPQGEGFNVLRCRSNPPYLLYLAIHVISCLDVSMYANSICLCSHLSLSPCWSTVRPFNGVRGLSELMEVDGACKFIRGAQPATSSKATRWLTNQINLLYICNLHVTICMDAAMDNYCMQMIAYVSTHLYSKLRIQFNRRYIITT